MNKRIYYYHRKKQKIQYILTYNKLQRFLVKLYILFNLNIKPIQQKSYMNKYKKMSILLLLITLSSCSRKYHEVINEKGEKCIVLNNERTLYCDCKCQGGNYE